MLYMQHKIERLNKLDAESNYLSLWTDILLYSCLDLKNLRQISTQTLSC